MNNPDYVPVGVRERDAIAFGPGQPPQKTWLPSEHDRRALIKRIDAMARFMNHAADCGKLRMEWQHNMMDSVSSRFRCTCGLDDFSKKCGV